MKNLLLFFITFTGSLCANAQKSNYDVIRQKQGNVPYLGKQADSLRQKYALDGFEVMMNTPVSNENAYDVPVLFHLEKGQIYQFIYIGEIPSKTYEVRLTNWEEHLAVKQRKMWGTVDGNIIDFSYIPQESEKYVANLFQYDPKKKDGTLFGHFLLLRKSKASVRPGDVQTAVAVNAPQQTSKPQPQPKAGQKPDFFDGLLK